MFFNTVGVVAYNLGLVRLTCGDGGYMVEDATGYCEHVWREDIITDSDQLGKKYVIALHPQHPHRSDEI